MLRDVGVVRPHMYKGDVLVVYKQGGEKLNVL